MKLRPYQIDAVDSIGGTSSNVIIKMPTGSGKTLVAFEFCLRRLAKNHRPAGKHNKAALFLVPTKDLVSQVSHSEYVLRPCVFLIMVKASKCCPEMVGRNI